MSEDFLTDLLFSPVSKGKTNDPQLQEIKEVLEEAVLAQTMLHSLAQMSGSSMVTCSSVTGHSGSSSVFYGVTDHSRSGQKKKEMMLKTRTH